MSSAHCGDLLDFLARSPTPWHAVGTCRERLIAAGFAEQHEGDLWAGGPAFVVRGGGSVIAWRPGSKAPGDSGFRLVGAHTDSPNLRLKVKPDKTKGGHLCLGVEVYGGVLLATWTDRELTLAGRVSVRKGGAGLAIEGRLVHWNRPLLRVPNLAIHLNRQVNQEGLKLNEQDHLPAVFACKADGPSFRQWLAAELGVSEERILGWDLCLTDVVPPALWGRDSEFFSAPRLDDLACAHAALVAFLGATASAQTQVLCLFDHEEIGSRTTRGAQSSLVRDVLFRLSGDGVELQRALARSAMLSADMAHGVHPNYPDKHEPEHRPMLGGGPVIKTHGEWRYATEGATAAAFRGLCADLGVATQEFMNRTDLACGTTIGPIVASDLGIPTVDLGSAMWSMHSIRETAAVADVDPMIRTMGGFFEAPDL